MTNRIINSKRLQKLVIFRYAGHGSGSQFLKGDDIQKVNVRAVTFLFGCSSVTSKDMGGRIERAGIWHFYLNARWWVFILIVRETRKNTILALSLTWCTLREKRIRCFNLMVLLQCSLCHCSQCPKLFLWINICS